MKNLATTDGDDSIAVDSIRVDAAKALGALGEMRAVASGALPALTRALAFDVETSGTAWDVGAREAVKDAIQHIGDPSAECMLKGKGQRYVMWGIR